MTDSNKTAAGTRAFRFGIALALVTSFLTVWTTIVRDDGNGIGFFMLILAAGVGSVAAWFRPAGMARTMAGVAIMQALLGIAIAPITARTPGAVANILSFSALFAALWLVSALLFRKAWKHSSPHR